MFLQKGERGLLVGKTGSGKTQNGLFHLQNTPLWPRIIFDTKIEDHFFSLPQNGEKLELIEGLENFAHYAKTTKRDKMPDYLLVRPTGAEFVDPEILDEYMGIVYSSFGPVFTYIDEVNNLHKNGRALPHLMNLLCRGRSRGKTTLMGSQRPAFISRSCLTESDRFYIHQLTDMKDRIRLSDVIPDFDKEIKPPKWHFHHFAHADHEKCELYKPVPYLKMNEKNKRQFRKNWL